MRSSIDNCAQGKKTQDVSKGQKTPPSNVLKTSLKFIKETIKAEFREQKKKPNQEQGGKCCKNEQHQSFSNKKFTSILPNLNWTNQMLSDPPCVASDTQSSWFPPEHTPSTHEINKITKNQGASSSPVPHPKTSADLTTMNRDLTWNEVQPWKCHFSKETFKESQNLNLSAKAYYRIPNKPGSLFSTYLIPKDKTLPRQHLNPSAALSNAEPKWKWFYWFSSFQLKGRQ